ncbi:unnamed protein product [Toxocara canis]|uniref:Uncharacterized protein n=1 Tax=Toxocara canis TaxID=6265 RepID=A0A183UPA6_TOXCA|nr:unnamed protein product [Toxocara canis]
MECSGVSSSGGVASALPGTQRMPQTFSGFLAGGRNSNGFDLESFTKNAAIETNKQQALGSQLSMTSLVEQKHVPGSGRLLSEGAFPRPILLQNRGFSGVMPGSSLLSLPPAAFQKTALVETIPGLLLQRSSRPIVSNSLLFDGARNGIGFSGENFEGAPFGDARLVESNSLANLRGSLMTHARSGPVNDGQAATFALGAVPFLRTLNPELPSNTIDSIQRSGLELFDTRGDPFIGRGSQLSRPVGNVAISQRPLTDSDKIGPLLHPLRMQKDSLLEEFRNEEYNGRNNISMSA